MSTITSCIRLLNLLRDLSDMKIFSSEYSPLATLSEMSSKSIPLPFSDVINGSNIMLKSNPNFAKLRKCSNINLYGNSFSGSEPNL